MLKVIRTLFFCFVATLASMPAFAEKIDSLVNSGEVIAGGKRFFDSAQYELAIKEFLRVDERDTNYMWAQSELALAYLNNNQNDEVIAVCREGKKQPSAYRDDFYRFMGLAHLNKEAFDESAQILKEGLELYPFNAHLRYQLGRVYYSQKKYVEAETVFHDVLKQNPYYSGAHLHLAVLSVLRGEKVHGMMAYGLYMALNKTDNSQLVRLERFVKNELTDESTIAPSAHNSFARLDEIIRARFEYPTRIPINASTVKQFQLMFDQFKEMNVKDDNPWVSFYYRFYRELSTPALQDAFVYHILSSTRIDQVHQWIAKNDNTLTELFKVANAALSKSRETGTLPSWGYKAPVSMWYRTNNTLEAIGNKIGQARVGQWYYFTENATRNAEGSYDQNGNKVGLWRYYRDDGTLSQTDNHDSGEILRYNTEGTLIQRYFITKGRAEGPGESFYSCGAIYEKLSYKEGMLHGKGQTFFRNGQLLVEFEYVNDTIHGPHVRYHDNGQVMTRQEFRKGRNVGAYKQYYPDGTQATDGQYDDDGNATGKWSFWHTTGQLKEQGVYANDEPVGEWNYFDHRGRKTESRNYDKGLFHGENLFYLDERLHVKCMYDSGILVSVEYFDLDGKTFATYGSPDGTFSGHAHFQTGEIKSDYHYEKGKATGRWNFYSRGGILEVVNNYVDNQLQGESLVYHASGALKSKDAYDKGKLSGPLEYYHRNGKMQYAGWYNNGNRQQKWLTYDREGHLLLEEFFLNDEPEGGQYFYDFDGKLISKRVYKGGKTVEEAVYNTKGEVISAFSGKASNGVYTATYPGGARQQEFRLVCGERDGDQFYYFPDGKVADRFPFRRDRRHGTYESYYANGIPEVTGHYDDGDASGYWRWYHEDGAVYSEGRYRDDQRDSVWTYYYDNGKVWLVVPYVAGKRHGTGRTYAPNGELLREETFHDDDMVAYRLASGGVLGKVTKFNGTGKLVLKYANGTVAFEEEFVKYHRNGHRKIYYPNGVPYIDYSYSMGESDGAEIIYYPSGKVRSKVAYRDGARHGTAEFYNKNGQLVRREQHIDGNIEGPVIFFENGKQVKQINFRRGYPAE